MTIHYAALEKGTLVKHYRIERVLGSGGFGIVYEATNARLEAKRIALKEFFPSQLVSRERDGIGICVNSQSNEELYEECLARFKNEGKVLGALDHRNVLQCYDFIEANNTAYLVMAYENGKSLSELLYERETTGKRYSEKALLKVFLPLADGIAYAHENDVLHRDIKPENVFIRRGDESPVLIDFGAAKEDFSKTTKSRAPYTDFYAPIDQLDPDIPASPLVDIHAFGALMYRAIARHVGPSAQTRANARTQKLPDPLTPCLQMQLEGYSDELLELVDECIAYSSIERPQSMSEVKTRLLAIRNKDIQAGAESQNNTNGVSRAKPFFLTATVALLVGLILGISVVNLPKTNHSNIVTGTWEATDAMQNSEGNVGNESILQAQELLMQLGYQVATNGILDERTQAAIELFETQKGLVVTGQADKVLIETLTDTLPLKKQFDLVVSQYDISALESFIEQNSDSIYVQQARKLSVEWRQTERFTRQQKEETAWESALSSNNIDGYKAYVSEYPNGRYLIDAEERIAKLSSVVVDKESILQAQELLLQLGYEVATNGILDKRTQTAIELFETQKGLVVTGQADKVLIETLTDTLPLKKQFDLIVSQDDISALESFIEQNSDSIYVQQARKLSIEWRQTERFTRLQKEEAAWESALSSNNIDGYEAYVSEYPNGRYLTDAEERIAKFSLDRKKMSISLNVMPDDVKVEILDTGETYEPSQRFLIDHSYKIRLSKEGYKTKYINIRPSASNHTFDIELEKRGSDQSIDLGNVTFVMKHIMGGSYRRGSNEWRDTQPIKLVTIPSFLLSESEVTWEMYQPCIEAGACPDNAAQAGDSEGKGKHPVTFVNWYDITQYYIPWLEEQTGQTFRLPSESEWEYAALAGSGGNYYFNNLRKCEFGNSYDKEIQRALNHSLTQCSDSFAYTAPAKSFLPNGFGLFDMWGNVREIVMDCYTDSYYSVSTKHWPYKEGDCESAIVRGGAYDSQWSLRYRSTIDRFTRQNNTGFRLAQDLKK